jgi:hypothetical protein
MPGALDSCTLHPDVRPRRGTPPYQHIYAVLTDADADELAWIAVSRIADHLRLKRPAEVPFRRDWCIGRRAHSYQTHRYHDVKSHLVESGYRRESWSPRRTPALLRGVVDDNGMLANEPEQPPAPPPADYSAWVRPSSSTN